MFLFSPALIRLEAFNFVLSFDHFIFIVPFGYWRIIIEKKIQIGTFSWKNIPRLLLFIYLLGYLPLASWNKIHFLVFSFSNETGHFGEKNQHCTFTGWTDQTIFLSHSPIVIYLVFFFNVLFLPKFHFIFILF